MLFFLLPLLCFSSDHSSFTGGKNTSLTPDLNGLPVLPRSVSSVHVLQEEEEVVVPDEELQEEQQVIETWTRNVKACTCDCESADSPTRPPTVSPLLTTPSPPQGHQWTCMPGEDSIYCVSSNAESYTCSAESHELPWNWDVIQLKQLVVRVWAAPPAINLAVHVSLGFGNDLLCCGSLELFG